MVTNALIAKLLIEQIPSRTFNMKIKSPDGRIEIDTAMLDKLETYNMCNFKTWRNTFELVLVFADKQSAIYDVRSRSDLDEADQRAYDRVQADARMIMLATLAHEDLRQQVMNSDDLFSAIARVMDTCNPGPFKAGGKGLP